MRTLVVGGFGALIATGAAALLAVGASALLAACAQAEATNFGPPEGLTGKTAPNPGGSDAGPAPTTDASLDAALPTPACDAGACSVSWTTAIYPNVAATGLWQCATGTSCHGTQGSLLTSLYIPDTPMGAYTALAQYKETDPTGRPVILPCSTDPDASTFECVVSNPSCGTDQMPLTTTGATALTAADLATITTWIQCGAPFN
jgi:hypothetical protein